MKSPTPLTVIPRTTMRIERIPFSWLRRQMYRRQLVRANRFDKLLKSNTTFASNDMGAYQDYHGRLGTYWTIDSTKQIDEALALDDNLAMNHLALNPYLSQKQVKRIISDPTLAGQRLVELFLEFPASAMEAFLKSGRGTTREEYLKKFFELQASKLDDPFLLAIVV